MNGGSFSPLRRRLVVGGLPSTSSSGWRRPCPASGPTRSSRRSTTPGHSTPTTTSSRSRRSQRRPASARGGRFDPTVHDAVVSAGYDRTFAEVATDEPAYSPRRCGGAIRINGRRIELEPGFRLDLGGIAKGYAVDRAVAILATAGPALVNAGGDIAGRGRLWPVGVETSDGRITLGLHDCALATSGRDRRRWRRGGGEAHHLIDPETGSPAESDYLRVTVTAPTAVDAEVLAKAVFLGAEPESPSVLVTADGRTVLAGGLE